jgi:SAM-dependent methyltransferase
MRFYTLDDLVDPDTGANLTVENPTVVDRPGPAVERCRHWCGYRGRSPEAVPEHDCCACHQMWIVSGDLVAGDRRYPIDRGIPRFVRPDDRSIDTATRESFGYEWQHFDVLLPEYNYEVRKYFDVVPPALFHDAVVLDAGCGMARWAHYAAGRGVRRLYAVDFSDAIERAADTLAGSPQAHCVQADVCRLPFRPGTFDLSYCLGVLHHLREPDAGMRSLVRVTKPDGSLLVYLYYALDNRSAPHRWLLAAVIAARRITSLLPKRLMHRLAWPIAVAIYWPLARLAAALDRVGLHALADGVPLSIYRKSSLKVMVNDAFDRFATPIERRYSRADIAAWLDRYDFEAAFSPHMPYWVALGRGRAAGQRAATT